MFKQKKPHGKPRASAVDKIVGNKLRRLRISAGMSQNELGEKLGITFQQIQKYEAGTNRISAASLYAFSKVFDTPVSEFFDDVVPSRDPKFLDEQKLFEKEFLLMFEDWKKIEDPILRKSFAKLLRSFVDQNSNPDE